MKKIAIVASGWHFPLSFYERMVKQKLPKSWKADYFCIAHRSPEKAESDKAGHVFNDDTRGKLDRILYNKIATVKELELLGWNYSLEPNTVGDWGNSSQWLDKNDYTKYDLFLFTHDDNLILNNEIFTAIIKDESFDKWDILTNSAGMPFGSIRGSFEFFKKKVLDLMGGKFDLSTVSLDRTGIETSKDDLIELYDWNNITTPLNKLIEEHKLSIAMLSPSYRVSAYVIEGERGYISLTHGANTEREEEGLRFLKENKIIYV